MNRYRFQSWIEATNLTTLWKQREYDRNTHYIDGLIGRDTRAVWVDCSLRVNNGNLSITGLGNAPCSIVTLWSRKDPLFNDCEKWDSLNESVTTASIAESPSQIQSTRSPRIPAKSFFRMACTRRGMKYGETDLCSRWEQHCDLTISGLCYLKEERNTWRGQSELNVCIKQLSILRYWQQVERVRLQRPWRFEREYVAEQRLRCGRRCDTSHSKPEKTLQGNFSTIIHYGIDILVSYYLIAVVTWLRVRLPLAIPRQPRGRSASEM